MEKKNEELARFLCRNELRTFLNCTNGTKLNGFIKECGSNFLIFDDKMLDQQIVFFEEIEEIEEDG